ncbi:MAG: hypothetical protein ABIY51_02830 [Ferruginibacter sp.]
MKFLFLLLLPLNLLAQTDPGTGKDITGLWKGYISTDEKRLPYELAITEQNGKLTGFSYTTFMVNGAEIVSMKKVQVKWQKENIIVEDDENVFNNFPLNAPKKIVQTNMLSLSGNPSQPMLTGSFSTKAPRQLRPARGLVFLEKKDSPADAKLMAKLDELDLTKTLSFNFNPPVKQDSTAIAIVEKPVIPRVNIPVTDTIAVVAEEVAVLKRQTVTAVLAKQAEQKRVLPGIVTVTRKESVSSATEKISLPPTLVTTSPKPVTTGAAKPVAVAKINSPVVKQTIAKTTPAVVKPAVQVVSKPPVVATAAPKRPAPVNIAVAPVIDLAKRKIETIDQLYIESDSLQFTLYDNGEVDGDTVSVILNGKTIVSRQGLSTTAFTKTIYLTPDMGDSIQLVMYAETLGRIPPNTGLLILNYDKQRREIRFSGDLNKNAAITLRKKEKG